MFICSSCSFFSGEKRWQPVKPTRHAFVHTVERPDETIPLIAKWYTGKAENAEYLVKANPTVNPERLVAGTLIYIPRKLLKTRKIMPRDFIEASFKKQTPKVTPEPVKPVSPDKDQESKEEFELFGPR